MTPASIESYPHIEFSNINNWDKIIKESYDQPIVVKFWAPWCRVCKRNPGLYRKLSSKYSDEKIKFFECKIVRDYTIITQYGVDSLPTVKAFKDGEIIPDIGAKGSKLLDFD